MKKKLEGGCAKYLFGEVARRAGAAERKHVALKYAKEKIPTAGQILRLQSKLQQVQIALKLATVIAM